MTRQVSNGLDLQGQRIQAVGDPSTGTDAANKSYVDNVARGISWHDGVIAASTANVNIASAPATLDGVTLTSGDRLLLKNQTTAAENGIYVFNGTGSALTRAADMVAGDVLKTGTAVSIDDGGATPDNANQIWHVTTPSDGTWTVGTTATTWSRMGGGAGVDTFNGRRGTVTLTKPDVTGTGLAATDVGATQKYAATFGDGSTTSFNIDHNLNSRDVIVLVYDTGTNSEETVDVVHSTVNRVVITYATAPANNGKRVVVIG